MMMSRWAFSPPGKKFQLSLTGMEAAQMAPSLRWIGLAALGFTLTGCVSQDQYSALKLERDRIAEQLTSAQREASQSKSAADAYKGQLESISASGSTGTALMANQAQQ